MKHLVLILGLMFVVSAGLGSIASPSQTAANETWTSVRSKHFFLIGNAHERDIRQVAFKLEQFRAVFARLFASAQLNAPSATRIIVFKNDDTYRPFKPRYQGKTSNDVAGYFLSATDINYLTLIAKSREDSPDATIFHEYVHALTFDQLPSAPLWVREGLAEYYSTFEVAEQGKKVWLGKPRADHARLLRSKTWLPLDKLFAAKQDSAHYNEQDQQDVFYAQSWALVHYLMLGKQGQRQPQFRRFLDALAQGEAAEESFRQAFQTSSAALESELRAYISHGSYPAHLMNLTERVEFSADARSAPLSEAEAQAFLGDLLLHLQREDEAESYLRQSLALNPELALARTSMGVLRAQQRRFDEAKQHLQRALAAEPQNFLVHYYYAFALSREHMDQELRVQSFPSEAAQKMRAALAQAIALAPEFTESYYLLAMVNLVSGGQLDESIALLKRAIHLAPSRSAYPLLLAQIHMRQGDYAAARRVVEPVARRGHHPKFRAQAQHLVETIDLVVKRLAELDVARQPVESSLPKEAAPKSVIAPSTARGGETKQARGLLTRVDCQNQILTLVIEISEREIKLQSRAPERIEFIAAPSTFKLDCGPRQVPLAVLVTYRAATAADAKFDGEVLTVEFIKP
jgi:tetratricopeptide (TPR) repeat protein